MRTTVTAAVPALSPPEHSKLTVNGLAAGVPCTPTRRGNLSSTNCCLRYAIPLGLQPRGVPPGVVLSVGLAVSLAQVRTKSGPKQEGPGE